MSDRLPQPHPNHRRRHSPQKKAKILRLAERIGVPAAAARSGLSIWTLYDWRQVRPGNGTKPSSEETPVKDNAPAPVRVRVPEAIVRQVVAVWRNNRGFGPSQVRNQLRRVGVRVDTKTVRKILRAHGYSPPGLKPPRSREVRRFEASRPLELVQMDVLQFHVHSQRVYLLLALDDHSRFITGSALPQHESRPDRNALFGHPSSAY